MVIMPDASYYEHYYAEAKEDGGGGREEPRKLLDKIEGVEARAATWYAPKRVVEVLHVQAVGDLMSPFGMITGTGSMNTRVSLYYSLLWNGVIHHHVFAAAVFAVKS
eukprot:COSAG02_NODE_2891_length_7795_cov_50.476351_1_plen_107_part_00